MIRKLPLIFLLLACSTAAAENAGRIVVMIERAGNQVVANVTVDSDELINLVDLVLEYDPSSLVPRSVDASSSRFSFEAIEDLEFAIDKVRVIRGEPHETVPKGTGLGFCRVLFDVIDEDGDLRVEAVMKPGGGATSSAIYRDDGVPTNILRSVRVAYGQDPRRPSGRISPGGLTEGVR